jgi:hypothetical protein
MNAPNELSKDRGLRKLTTASLLFLLAAVTVNAQQINGTPGSPSATTTIEGKYLPPSPAPFGGVINLSARESKPYWPPREVPPKGAPNVLLIMTDDAVRSDREHGAALHAVPLHRALLAHAGGGSRTSWQFGIATFLNSTAWLLPRNLNNL